MCQELIDEGKSVVAYLTLHVPQQQGQGARTTVSDHTGSNLMRLVSVTFYAVRVNGRLLLQVVFHLYLR